MMQTFFNKSRCRLYADKMHTLCTHCLAHSPRRRVYWGSVRDPAHPSPRGLLLDPRYPSSYGLLGLQRHLDRPHPSPRHRRPGARGRFIAVAAARHAAFASRRAFLCLFRISRFAKSKPHPGHVTRGSARTGARMIRDAWPRPAGGCCPASESDSDLDSESDWPAERALSPDECPLRGIKSARSMLRV